MKLYKIQIFATFFEYLSVFQLDFLNYLHTPQLPPSLLQCLQYLQFLQAVQEEVPEQVASTSVLAQQFWASATGGVGVVQPISRIAASKEAIKNFNMDDSYSIKGIFPKINISFQ